MYVYPDIYIVILQLDTSAEARTRRPAGDLARRIPTLRGRTPTYQHNTYSNPRQSILQATMRKHAPQAQSHITKAATADPLNQHRGPPEAPNTKAMRRASIRRPIRTQGKGGCTARASTHHGGELIGQDDPHATDSAYQRDPPTSQMRLADNWSQIPADAEDGVQAVVLVSIDLRSQHGRLVSARVSASVRKGVLGSCNRAASQAAGRAYRIVLQRSRPRRGGEPWFERASRAEIL